MKLLAEASSQFTFNFVFQGAIVGLALLDLCLTIIILRFYIQIFPERKEWWNLEVNPVARFVWKKFGLKVGSFILGVYAVLLMGFVSWLCLIDRLLMGILLGVYLITFANHVRILLDVQRVLKKKQVNNVVTR